LEADVGGRLFWRQIFEAVFEADCFGGRLFWGQILFFGGRFVLQADYGGRLVLGGRLF
jgi:hypothetical protein